MYNINSRKIACGARTHGRHMKYKIVTYGCQMNVHESEKLAGLLARAGYECTENSEEADVLVFNTCCIRDTAERRALGNIGVTKALKRRNPSLIVAVCGCMPQQEGAAERIAAHYPYIDIILGTRNISRLPAEIERVLAARAAQKRKGRRTAATDMPEDYLSADEATPTLRTSYPNAWVNIIYGCNNFCTYCIVPYVRGREISRSEVAVLDEVKRAVDEGYGEITLLGQNVNSYGHDLGGGENFARLLKKIDRIPGKFRVRFMTSHPKDLTRDVAEAMAESDKICRALHLPVQSGSDPVLRDMNRRYTREKYLAEIAMLRELMPDIGLTTDIMVGFPTETEEDFQDTMSLVREVGYLNAFTFIYSPRKGTPAAAMPQLPYEIKKRRIGELIALQNSVTKELSERFVSGSYEVLAEDIADGPRGKNGMICGRTDGGRLVNFKGSPEDIGKFFRVRITSSRSASLFGEAEEKL